MTVVGRLLHSLAPAGVAPVGEASWSDTRIVLPPALPHGAYRDALTGNIVELDRGPSAAGLRLSQVFAHLPSQSSSRPDGHAATLPFVRNSAEKPNKIVRGV